MILLNASLIAERIRDLLHFETQKEQSGLSLTVAGVSLLEKGGALDFGGSEFEEAKLKMLQPEKKDEEDEYGWWELSEGLYLIEFNESVQLEEGELGLISPLPRLLRAGGSHPLQVLTGSEEPLRSLLQLSIDGVRLKENCRISKLTILGG